MVVEIPKESKAKVGSLPPSRPLQPIGNARVRGAPGFGRLFVYKTGRGTGRAQPCRGKS